MICDKCHEPVDPENNAKLYDATFASLTAGIPVVIWERQSVSELSGIKWTTQIATTGYQPDNDVGVPVFRDGQVIPGDVEATLESVKAQHSWGRHLYPTATCEGSPSRRRNIEEGHWGDGRPMGELASLAQQAYKAIQKMEAHHPGQ